MTNEIKKKKKIPFKWISFNPKRKYASVLAYPMKQVDVINYLSCTQRKVD